MKKNNLIYFIYYFFITHISLAHADKALLFNNQQAATPYIFVGVLVSLALALIALLAYGCIQNISIGRAVIISGVTNVITASLILPLFVFAHMDWWHMPFKFAEEPLAVCGIWIFLYLASSLIAVGVIYLLFGYPIKKLLIPLFVGNFIVFILIINTYILLALYRFRTGANVFTKLLIEIFNSL